MRQLALALVLFALFSSRPAAQNSDNTAFPKLEYLVCQSEIRLRLELDFTDYPVYQELAIYSGQPCTLPVSYLVPFCW